MFYHFLLFFCFFYTPFSYAMHNQNNGSTGYYQTAPRDPFEECYQRKQFLDKFSESSGIEGSGQTNTEDRYLRMQNDPEFTDLQLTPAAQKPGCCKIFLQKSANWVCKKVHAFKNPLLILAGAGLSYLSFFLVLPTFKNAIEDGINQAISDILPLK